MSLLSDALERHLKAVQNPNAPVVPKPEPVADPHIVRTCSLFFSEGSSDKEYHIRIERASKENTYSVIAQYGRRGGTLMTALKTTWPVDLNKAIAVYNKVINEKKAKGYQ